MTAPADIKALLEGVDRYLNMHEDRPDTDGAAIALGVLRPLRTLVPALAAENAALQAERDDLLDRVEELERAGEIIAEEFEGDLWVAVRKILNETEFDWSGDAQTEGVKVDDAYQHIMETLRDGASREARVRAERDAALAKVERLRKIAATPPPDEVSDNTFDAGWFWLQGLIDSALTGDKP
jgi:hypothetical protein